MGFMFHRGISGSYRLLGVGRRWYSSENWFKLFPKTFPTGGATWDVDITQLRREYRQLQAVHHPDIVANAGSDEDSGMSSKLNKAFSTLLKPVLRSQYLLQLQGIDLTNEEVAQGIMQRNPQLLMDVLDVHEQLEELETEEDIKELKGANKERIAKLQKAIGAAFGANDWDKAAQLTVELKYWDNLDKAIKEWEPGKPVQLTH
ncbi:J-type chaperone JAC1 Ecym_7225 [Eremothecium cymbalariae DBVPG|uniref:Co-chaperone HscB C-terminal oligomerisation domain-containing protein n=1 Tax=Eremothecium cymbalariae (strain CBS 270.75 / DBVPG 7215 / KCTC 17166 / NRRL Y-17582) TaxID=931890 RepID=G8JW56_ERECY|nr:hypothetical protein Ecym_7225 [Eremothecium cymbalariae DBVPG\